MFYVVAKVSWFLLQPSSLMVGAVIAGTLLTYTAWRRLAQGLLWGAAAALLIGGLSPLGDVLLHPLEQRFMRTDLDRPGPPITGIIVLGGVVDSHEFGSPDVVSLSEAGERFTEAVILAQRLPGARLVFSGGSGNIVPEEETEARAARDFFEAFGVAENRITLEAKSRDTCENAEFSAQLLAPRADQRWLLVTSAWHMPRAMGCFRHARFAVEAWPVDYRAANPLALAKWDNSISEGLRRIDNGVREYVGLLAYYLAGRTDTLFPGP